MFLALTIIAILLPKSCQLQLINTPIRIGVTLRCELEVLDSIHVVVKAVSLEDWVHGIQQGQSSVTSRAMKLHTGLSKQDQDFIDTPFNSYQKSWPVCTCSCIKYMHELCWTQTSCLIIIMHHTSSWHSKFDWVSKCVLLRLHMCTNSMSCYPRRLSCKLDGKDYV